MLFVMNDDVLKSDFVKLVHSIDERRKRRIHPQKVRKLSKRQVQTKDFSSMSSDVPEKERDFGIANSERLTDFEGSEKISESSVKFISNGVFRRIKSVKRKQTIHGVSVDNTWVELRTMTDVTVTETEDDQILTSESCESRHDAEELKGFLSSGNKRKISLNSGKDRVSWDKFSICCDDTDGDEGTLGELQKRRKGDKIATQTSQEASSDKCFSGMVNENGELAESSLSSEQNSSLGRIKNVCKDSVDIEVKCGIKTKIPAPCKCEPSGEIVDNPLLLAGKNVTMQERNGVVLSEEPSGSGESLNRKLTGHYLPTEIPTGCYVALDCEMVGVGEKGRRSRLARCSIVDYAGSVVYDSYILPEEPITDYRTPWSGITRRHMLDAIPVNEALPEIKAVLQDKIVIGHAVYNDFKVIHFQPPVHLIRDTASCKQLINMADDGSGGRSLKKLSLALLGRHIQMGKKGHCSVEDARASLDLFKLVRNSWEAELFLKWRQKGLRVTAGLADSQPAAREEDYLHDKFWPV